MAWDKLILPCIECGGDGEVEYEIAVPDFVHGGYLKAEMGECHTCEGAGELAPLDFEPWDAAKGSAERLNDILEELADLSVSDTQGKTTPEMWNKKMVELESCRLDLTINLSKLMEWHQ